MTFPCWRGRRRAANKAAPAQQDADRGRLRHRRQAEARLGDAGQRIPGIAVDVEDDGVDSVDLGEGVGLHGGGPADRRQVVDGGDDRVPGIPEYKIELGNVVIG